ncbi:gliding motility-associated C-terminal domain-containing protein [Lewinella sp. 4G2]|uniref:T9SS type B sorting domain-containing protein n=1 Tax=Lewinella sp. 4G2 TaxID=1803372 RepID=UPI0007B4A6D8|nr:gliding motility-associated C-terminal domain-containing protein [Lewinella sp. 4G2]OAV46289.1 hypothetical protein A3850_018720 [Lewinella sp. 4G2]
MKAFHLLLLLLSLSCTLSADSYYWVGGSGEWDDVGHWATTSGGSNLYFSIPSANDDVFIDANSFTGPDQTIDLLQIFAQCRNLRITTNEPGAALIGGGFSSTDGGLDIHGDLFISGSLEWQYSSLLTFRGTNGPTSINTGGKLIRSAVTLEGTPTSIFNVQGDFSSTRRFLKQSGAVDFAAGATLAASAVTFRGDGQEDYADLFIQATGTVELDLDATEAASCATLRVEITANNIVYLRIGGEAVPRIAEFTYVQTGPGSYLSMDERFDFSVPNQELSFDAVTLNGDTRLNPNLRASELEYGPGWQHEINDGTVITVEDELRILGTCTERIGFTADQEAFFSAPAAATINVEGADFTNISASGGANFTANESGGFGNVSGWSFVSANGFDRYWVGNSGDWTDTNHWSYTSGGPSGACVPGPSNNVIFDAASFTVPGQTVTILEGQVSARTMDWRGNNDAATLYMERNGDLDLYGSLYLTTNCTWDSEAQNARLNFRGDGAGKEIQSDGGTARLRLEFQGLNGEWTLLDSLEASSDIIVDQGSLITADYPLSCGGFLLTRNDASVDFGTSTIYLKSTNGTARRRFQLDADGTSFFEASQASLISYETEAELEIELESDGTEQNHIKSIFTSGPTEIKARDFYAETVEVLRSTTFNLNGRIDNLLLSPGSTYSFEGTGGGSELATDNFRAEGSCTDKITLESVSGTYTLRSATPQSGMNLQIENVAAAGTTWTATESLDLGGAAGWTFTGAPTSRTVYWVGGAGSWFDSAHWSETTGGAGGACIPSRIDDVVLDAASFNAAGELRFYEGATPAGSSVPECRTFDARGLDEDVNFLGDDFDFYGSCFLDNRITNELENHNFRGTGTVNFQPAGREVDELNILGSGTLNLRGPILDGTIIDCKNGRFNSNDHEIDISLIIISPAPAGSPVQTICDLGSSRCTLTASSFPIRMISSRETQLLVDDAYIIFPSSYGTAYLNPGDYDMTLEYTSPDNEQNAELIANSPGGPGPERARVRTAIFRGGGIFDGPVSVDSLILTKGKNYALDQDPESLVIHERLIAVGTACFPIGIEPDRAGATSTIRMVAGAEAEMDYVRLDNVSATGPGGKLAGRNSTNINNSSPGWVFETNGVVRSLDREFLGPDLDICNANIPPVSPNVPPGFVADYLWQDGSTDAEFQPPGPGTYYLNIVFDEGECQLTDTIRITNGGLDLEADQTITACDEATVTITVPEPAAAGYSWNVISGTASNLSYASITLSVPGIVELEQTNATCSGATRYTVVDGSIAPIDTLVMLSAGDSYTTAQMTYTPADGETEREVYTGANGCDSVRNITFQVTANDVTGPDILVDQCGQGLYITNQSAYFVTQDTTITEMYTASSGVDSTQRYLITVLESPQTTFQIPCLPLNQFITDQGVYTITTDTLISETYVAANGCDSTVSFALYVRLVVEEEATDYLCAPGPYSTDQQDYFITQDTTFEETYLRVSGCDSVQSYVITVGEAITGAVRDNYCAPTAYFTGAETYFVTQDTVITEVFSAFDGCDSTVTYTITINENVSGPDIELEGCGNTRVTTDLRTYFVTQDTVINETYPSAGGCDSTQIYRVSIDAGGIVGESFPVVCAGTDYITGMRRYRINQDTIIEEMYQTLAFCDSLHRFIITTNSSPSNETQRTLCGASAFQTDQQDYFITQDTVFTETYTTVENCDSLQTYRITISDVLGATTTSNFCEPTVFFSGQTNYFVERDTVIEETYARPGECDSVHTYQIFIGEESQEVIPVNQCGPGEVVTERAVYFVTQDTLINELYSSVTGCDSTITYSVTVNDLTRDTLTFDPFNQDNLITAQGTYAINGDTIITETYVGSNGCDSMQTYVLVRPSAVTTTGTATQCGPGLFTTPQADYFVTQDTTIRERYVAESGGDSLRITEVTVNELFLNETTVSQCGPQLVSTGAASYFVTQDTVITERFTSAAGCDSTEVFRVTITPAVQAGSDFSLCGPETFATGLSTYFVTRDTVIEETFVRAGTCDSVHTYTVTIGSGVTGASSDQLCGPETYAAGLNTYFVTQDTVIEETFVRPGTCDSVHTYTVTIGSGVMGASSDQLCGPETFATGLSTYFVTRDTVIEETFVRPGTCDSVHTYTVTIGSGVTGASSDQLCGPELYTTGLGTYFITRDTVIEETFVRPGTCDSVHTYTVTIGSGVTGASSDQLCGPETFATGISTYFVTRDTVIEETFVRPGTCDSVHTYTVTIRPAVDEQFNEFICQPGPVVTAGGTYFVTQDTVINEPFTTAEGCTGSRVTTVQLGAAAGAEVRDRRCGPSTVTTGQDTYFVTRDTVIEETYLRPGECDSIQTYRIFIDEAPSMLVTDRFCEPTLFVTERSDYFVTQDTTFTEVYPTAGACDSTVTYQISVEEGAANTTVLNYCNAEMLTTDQGTYFITQDTVFTELYPQPGTCDSAQTYRVFVGRETTVSVAETLCEAGPVAVGDEIITVARDTVVERRFTRPGTCDSVVNYTFSLTTAPMIDDLVEVLDISCAGADDARILIGDLIGATSLRVNDSLFTSPAVLDSVATGGYTVAIQYGNGCEVTETFTISDPAPLTVDLPDNVVVLEGDRIQLPASADGGRGGYVYSYLVSDTLAEATCLNCPALDMEPLNPTLVFATVMDESGCLATDSTLVQIARRRDAYLPTAFSPNGDGVNDRLMVYTRAGRATVEEMAVYDRWGGEVFRAGDFPAGDLNAGWDGDDRPTGTYIVRYRVRWSDGEVTLGSGVVNLLR